MKHLGFRKNDKEFQNAKFLQNKILILPMHLNLSLKDILQVCGIIKKFMKKN